MGEKAASQTSGPRKGRNKIQSVFCTDTRRAKNTSHPESASFAGAVRGVFPNFGSPAQRVPKFLPFPARPAGGRAVTGVGLWAAGQAKKKEDPRRVPPTRKGGSRAERTSLRPGVLSSGFLLKKAGLPRRSRRGKPRRRAHPAPVQKAPQTGAPPGAGRATTWQVWTCAGPSLDHLPIQRSPG